MCCTTDTMRHASVCAISRSLSALRALMFEKPARSNYAGGIAHICLPEIVEQSMNSDKLDTAAEDLGATIIMSQSHPAQAGSDADERMSGRTVSGMASETRGLLQTRLLVAGVILLFGFGLFFIRSLFLEFIPVVRAVHVTMLVLLSAAIVTLSSRNMSLITLRRIEWVIFLAVLVSLVTTQVAVVSRHAREDNSPYLVAAAKATILYVLLVITLYCMFIPNRWQRAARMVALYAAAPAAVVFIARLTVPDVNLLMQRLASAEQITENLLILIIGSTCTVFGTDVINRLRAEVFEAKQIGQYRIGSPIGHGGMGRVYRAEHEFLKRPCAIKLIAPDRASDAEAVLRFKREVQTAASLTHWNTIDIYDYGQTDDGLFFYVMELLQGLSLQELVDQYGPVLPERLVFLSLQICDALNEAHAAGLVHRDMKPTNIFVAFLGRKHDVAKLLDFGLVKVAASDTDSTESVERQISGSPLYLSPEQARGEEADARSDIYSLGSVMYFALTGQPPFDHQEILRLFDAHIHEAPVPIMHRRSEIPADLAEIIHRCLSKSAGDRYQSIDLLAEALSACECSNMWSFENAATWWQTHGQQESVS